MSVFVPIGGGGGYITETENGGCIFSDFGTGTLSSAKTLSVTASSLRSGVGSTCTASIAYTLDGGTTWTTLHTFTNSSFTPTAYTAAVPSGQDLALVKVAVSTDVGTPANARTLSMSVTLGDMAIL
jgi:hypothetical protein